MFHPIGPYLLLSLTIAWKNVKDMNNFLHSSPLLLVSKYFTSSLVEFWLWYSCKTLAFTPLGGSLVILIPCYRRFIGKSSLDIEVSQILNSDWNDLSLISCLWFFIATSSIISSNLGSQLTAKWQFWSIIHWPAAIDSLIAVSAASPCPLPKD